MKLPEGPTHFCLRSVRCWTKHTQTALVSGNMNVPRRALIPAHAWDQTQGGDLKSGHTHAHFLEQNSFFFFTGAGIYDGIAIKIHHLHAHFQPVVYLYSPVADYSLRKEQEFSIYCRIVIINCSRMMSKSSSSFNKKQKTIRQKLY